MYVQFSYCYCIILDSWGHVADIPEKTPAPGVSKRVWLMKEPRIASSY